MALRCSGSVDPFGFAESGDILFPDGRGRGYATRTVRLVAEWVLGDLGLGRLQARASKGNVASERVLERAVSGAKAWRAQASCSP